MHDRADISPGMMENMKHDIIEVIKKYVDIDEAEIDLALENEEDSVALVANIPIMTVLRRRRQGR
jgi:cell division topological specificity factor